MAVAALRPNHPAFERRRCPRELPASAHTLAARFGQALTLLEEGRWPQAFAELKALADGGHVSAARIALTMVKRGGLLFGGHYHASAQDLARWQQLAG
jgi:hypothetical protein